MAKGYPSRARARKAFGRGYYARGGTCPYGNGTLAALWKRGAEMRRTGRQPSPLPEMPRWMRRRAATGR